MDNNIFGDYTKPPEKKVEKVETYTKQEVTEDYYKQKEQDRKVALEDVEKKIRKNKLSLGSYKFIKNINYVTGPISNLVMIYNFYKSISNNDTNYLLLGSILTADAYFIGSGIYYKRQIKKLEDLGKKLQYEKNEYNGVNENARLHYQMAQIRAMLSRRKRGNI